MIVLISCGYLYNYKKFLKSKDKIGINSQRESIESKIYILQDQLSEDNYNFIDSNKLLIKFASPNSFERKIPNYSFFRSLGINLKNCNPNTHKAFCLMPFHKQYLNIYLAIQRACYSFEIKCSRSDEYYEPGNLLKQIVSNIIDSRYIFAILDGRNPNVFYEIGLAHAIGKPVFLIGRHDQTNSIPFDISSERMILYKAYPELEKKINEVLEKYSYIDGRNNESSNYSKTE